MLGNAFWLYLFSNDNSTYFGYALIDIVVMLVTAVKTLDITTHNHLNNWYENILFRGGMSIYAGWLTTATILNSAFLLKSLGFDQHNVKNEIFWSKTILSVAFIIYNSYSFIERNPLFGAIFIWVLVAIKDNNSDLRSFIDTLLPLHIISDILIGAYSYYEYRAGTITHGLFL
jgi:hypothetical protein